MVVRELAAVLPLARRSVSVINEVVLRRVVAQGIPYVTWGSLCSRGVR